MEKGDFFSRILASFHKRVENFSPTKINSFATSGTRAIKQVSWVEENLLEGLYAYILSVVTTQGGERSYVLGVVIPPCMC
jgi:hypothetical protein